ncbi:hypothetical protein AXG93_79s1000 [Marchantia polymorpha subsp. ruderalis]|uniref:Uncharacterized protein n=1 Tax=Marchantia polymorpha subsp. ruderalis TaxID=1480154 RepID=A0A176W7L8_MARPO|nr:hypothetical protein AXG93_79s1000 [Marchantia polymorpha subsp. ruderalis]
MVEIREVRLWELEPSPGLQTLNGGKDCVSLRASHTNVQKATLDLCKRLEASKVAYVAEVQRVEELTVALAKRNQLHAAELAKAEERRAE